MAAGWPPERKLPPGFPLAPMDESGHAIAVGAKIRIISIASCVNELPPEDRARLRACEGQVFPVLEIDRYGMIWFEPGGGGGKFSLKPREVAVI